MSVSFINCVAPGNFYRLENNPLINSRGISEIPDTLLQTFIKLYRQIRANIIMMKNYWFFLIIVCLFLGSMIILRNKRKIILSAAGFFSAGFLSLFLNCVIDYMPARIYAAAFIWFSISCSLFSIIVGSLLHSFVREIIISQKKQSSYVLLLVFSSFCFFPFL